MMIGNGTILLVDMDDTIECLCEAWVEYANKLFHRNVDYKDIRNWDVSKYYSGISKEDVYGILEIEDLWNNVKPRADAIEYLKKLYDEGYEIYICTATLCKNVKVKFERIIQMYFPYIDWNHVIIIKNKQMLKGDYLIDDGVHNLIGGSYEKILMTAPHNKDYDANANGMYRADNWETVYNIVHRGR